MSNICKLSGRIDTTTAERLASDLGRQLAGVPQDSEVIFDCSHLSYISSTGLRVVLGFKKRYPRLRLTNVGSEVYNIFDMTGFTRILDVQKAFRQVSISGCRELARGGVGVLYRLDEDTVIKVFSPECKPEVLERERTMAKEAFVQGMPTAIPFDIVWVPETQSYGLVFELIRADTLASVINAHPYRLEHYASLFGGLLRHNHSIHVQPGTLPQSMASHWRDLERIQHLFPPAQVQLFRTLLTAIPDGDRLLHNDFHPKNVMLSGSEGSEELLLIDMGEVSSGHPLIELSHTYSSLHVSQDMFLPIIGFPHEWRDRFWHATLRSYFQTDDEALLSRYNEMIFAAATVRSGLWLALAEFPQETIDHAVRYLDSYYMPHRERILAAARYFADFPLPG